MKNIFKTIFCLGMLSVLLFACKKDDVKPELTVIETKIETGPLGNIGAIKLSSADYSATVEDEWLKIQQDADVLHLTMEQNNSKSNRTTLIHITSSSGKKLVVPMTQRGLLFEVNSPVDNLNFSLKGGVKKINVISNVEYQVKFDQDWLSHEIIGDTLYVKASPYAPADPNQNRNAEATILYGNEEVNLQFSQLNIFSYEDFLGTAYLSFIDNATRDESLRKRIPVTITEKVSGSVFTMTTGPIAAIGNNTLHIDVTYNPDATLQINTGQLQIDGYLDTRANDINNGNLVKVYAAAYNIAAKAFAPKFETLFKATGENLGAGKRYKFVKYAQFDNNPLLPALLKLYDPDGFAFSAYRMSSGATLSRYAAIPPYMFMLDMILEK